MASFISGPWAVGDTKNGGDKLTVYCANEKDTVFDGVMMADTQCMFLTQEQSLANAQLISAAPDMVEALRGAEYVFRNTVGLIDQRPDEYKAIKAALSKALGQDASELKAALDAVPVSGVVG